MRTMLPFSATAAGRLATPFLMLFLVLLAPALRAQNDRSIALDDVVGVITSLEDTRPEIRQVKGTLPPLEFFNKYDAVRHHVQGVARLTNGNYVFSHDVRNSVKSGFVVFSRPNDRAKFRSQAEDGAVVRHPSGMQASGNVVAVPAYEGGQRIDFFDGSDPDTIVHLTHLTLRKDGEPGDSGSDGVSMDKLVVPTCVGLVYHEKQKVHYLVEGYNFDEGNGTLKIFKSNGLALTDPNCRWQYVGYTDAFISQGGISLLYQSDGALFVAATYRQYGGEETIKLSRLDGSTDTTFYRVATEITTVKLSKTGTIFTDPEPGFRWGGTVVPTSATSVDVVGVRRLLSGGDGADYTRIKVWKSKNVDIDACTIYSLYNLNTEKYIDVSPDTYQDEAGTNALAMSSRGGIKWRVEYYPAADNERDYFLFRDIGTGRLLAAPEGPFTSISRKNRAYLAGADVTGENQETRWTIERLVDGSIRLISQLDYDTPGKALLVDAGENVRMSDFLATNQERQKFELRIQEGSVQVNCGNPITLTLDANGQAYLDYAEAMALGTSDPCLTYSVSKDLFTCADVGTQKVTLTANGLGGSLATCEIDVTVVDPAVPELICPGSQTLANTPGMCGHKITDGTALTPTLTEAGCGGGTLTNDLTGTGTLKGATLPVGQTVITWTLTTSSGQTRTCPVTVTVQDQEGPRLTLQPLTAVFLDDQGSATITADQLVTSVVDNCTPASAVQLSLSRSSFTCADLGVQTVTVTATDGSGNKTPVPTIVTVRDNTPPTLAVRPLTVSLDENGTATIAATQLVASAADNCTPTGALKLALSRTSFTCADLGTQSVTVTATDASNNATPMETTVTVVDRTPPMLNLQPLTVSLDENGTATIAATQLVASASDNCTPTGALKLALSRTSFTCADLGTNDVTVTATDASGNATPVPTTVTVVDQLAPTVTGPGDLVVGTDPGRCTAVVTYDIGASDNCGATLEMTAGLPSGSDFPLGTTVVSYTASDAAGNTTPYAFTVTVEDREDPVVRTRDAAVSAGIDGAYTLTADLFDAGSTDNCSIASVTVSPMVIPCFHSSSEQQVTLTVTDEVGNVTQGYASVTLLDDDDCDGVGNLCDQCPGGNDQVDGDGNGVPDCAEFPGLAYLPASWTCGSGKNKQVYVCLNGMTLCVAPQAVANLVRQGAYVGPCDDANCADPAPVEAAGIRNGAVRPQMQVATGLEIFPNPTRDRISIKAPIASDSRTVLTIHNGFGAVVLLREYATWGGETITTELPAWPAGLYYLTLESAAGERFTGRFFVAEKQ